MVVISKIKLKIITNEEALAASVPINNPIVNVADSISRQTGPRFKIFIMIIE